VFTVGVGCAGEIKIREDEDYDKWALDILVKFRDTERLQLLTGQRQSGGVRMSCVLHRSVLNLVSVGTCFDHHPVPDEPD
jgi:hypothetical protein